MALYYNLRLGVVIPPVLILILMVALYVCGLLWFYTNSCIIFSKPVKYGMENFIDTLILVV